MKQTKLWLATIATLWCSLTANAHDFEVDGIYYNITSSTDLTVEVTYQGSSSHEYEDEYSGAVTIPSIVTYYGITYSVTSIGNYAFFGCSSLTAITIPEGVTSIGESAFSGCSSLTSITIPEGVTSIGDRAFSGCSSLTAITIPEGVTSIGGAAFRDCSSLTSITIPEGVTSIGGSAFAYCSSLTSINIPEGVTSIGGSAFSGCSSLTSINIPEGVTSIGYSAFSDCSSLTSINIPEGVTSIGVSAFAYCTALKKVIIEDGSSTLSLGYNHYSNSSSSSTGQGLFYDCPLEEVYLGRNLSYRIGSSYGYSPFYKSNRIPTISLGNNVTSIPSYLFYNNTSLISITIPEGVTSIGGSAFYGCSRLTAINIPEGVTSIENYAFYNCSSLTSITLPEGVTSIGGSAFYGCSRLTAINIPEGVTSIGGSAFYGCSRLTAINIPEGVTSIGHSAFYDCESLTAINIPEGVTSIGDYAFQYCSSLYKVVNCSSLPISKGSADYGYVAYYAKNVVNGNEWNAVGDFQFYTSNGIHYLINYIGDDLNTILPNSYNGENYKIDDYAFSDCESLTAITIPEGVTSIGNYAFYNCSSLTSITIPEGSQLTSIGEQAFRDCSSLTSITIPESVTSIGEGAFDGCSSLTAINIPEGVTSIGNCAFLWCSSLTSITIPESVTSIGSYAFSGCSSLTAITIPEGVTSIGNCAFSGCSSLTAITIPEGVTSIGNNAFSSCSSLISITLPESVTSIGNCAFDNCTSLKELIIGDGSTTLSLGYNYYYSNGTTGQGLFYDCPLEEVYLGRNLSYNSGSSYGYSPFYDKDALTKVTIGNEVTEIGQDAFRGCDNIHSLVMGNGVLSIGSNAFSTPEKVIWLTNTPPTGYTNIKGDINYAANDQYSSLSNVKVYPYLSSMFEVDGVKYVPVSPSERTCHAIDCAYDSTATAINVGETASFKGVAMKVTEVMPYTFYGNDHIEEVSVSHLGNIGNYAFCDCDAIETVNVSNPGNIGSKAFYDCNGIKSVDIRNQGSIGSLAFYGCNAMLTAIVANCMPTAPSVDDTLLTFADWTSTNHNHSSTSSETYTFTAGEGATLSFSWSVSSEAGYDELIVTLDGTTILEKSGNLSGTYSNTISEGSHTLVVKYTKDYSSNSGSDQASVSNITVDKSATVLVAGVGSEAFSGCSSLKTVTLGDSIGSLGDKAFYQCTSLQEIVIPDSVKSVGSYCFSGCSAMKSAVIGNGLTDIKEYTSQNCTSLADVMVGDGVTTISSYAFTGCSALTDVMLGRSVATINDYAFQNCSSLTEITLPQAVAKVGDYVFSGCSKLADVVIADRTTALALGSNGSSPLFADCPLDSVYIGGKITYSTTSSKGYSPFYRNTSLRTVVITDREEQIYDNEFYGCTNLKSVTIGNGVKSIGDYAFSGCSSLDGFSFGSNMESIGAEAFSDCTNLTTITSHAAVPPTCGTQALDDINKWSCTLRVPSGYAAAYQAADQWKEFFFVEDVVEVEKYVLTYVVDGEVYHTDTLVHKATIVLPEAPTKEGYTFSGWSEAPETMPAEDITISGTFTINKYLVTFKIGDEVIAADSLEYGATIVAPEAPEREGHTFNGWGEVATVVPANDLIYEGSYSVNSYLLTYMVDGEAVQSDSIAYGTAITLPEAPTKEGYTFSGWSEAPETMPAENITISGTFTVNKYLVTFKIGDEVIAADSLEYGATIVAPEAPEREGHSFNGWGEVATVVPANDLIYEGSYSVNSYLLTYMVDGEAVQSDSIAYGTAITLPEAPTKEGYTFSGWSEAPETMPAEDITISGTFTVNKYLVTFKIGDEVIAADSLEYGATIVAPEAPEREGHTFNGWGEVAETVPAGDVTYEGSYTVNIYKVYYYVGEELVHTAEVAYGEKIPEYIYEPTKEGDVLEGWTGEPYDTMPAHDVTYTANITNGIEQLTNAKGQLTIYDLNGRKIEVEDLRELLRGIYIVNGHRVLLGD